MAHDEWLKIRERTMRSQRELRERQMLVGLYPFGLEPAGPKYSKQLVPSADGRTFIPEIFQRVADGDSLATVAAWLESQGAKPRSGGKWWPRSVGVLIRNPVYRGQRCETRIVEIKDPNGKITKRRV